MLEDILKLHQAGQLDEAEQQYREFLAFNPDDPEALHLLAILRRQQGDLGEALELAHKAADLVPDRANYLNTLGGLQLHARFHDQALESFAQALRLEPKQFGAALGIAQITLLQGDLDASRDALDKAERIVPGHPQILFLRGSIAQARGDHDRAIKLLIEAAKLVPSNPAIQANLARSFEVQGQTGFAEQALRNAVQLKSDYHVARIALAQLLLRTGRPDESLAEFETVLEQREDHPLALAGRADIRKLRGDRDGALEDYRKAHAGMPDSVSIKVSLIEAMMMADEQAAGRQLLADALTEQPQQPELRRLDLAIAIRTAAGRYLQACQEWLGADPESDEARERVVGALEADGQFEQADELARECLRRNSRSSLPRLILARSALRAQRPEDAQVQLDRLTEASLDPSRKVERASLRGLARDALGDFQGAVDAWLNGQRLQTGLAPLATLPDPITLTPAPARAEADSPSPCFLVALPGAGSESLVALARTLGATVLSDRFGRQMRADPLATGDFVTMAKAPDEHASQFRDRYLAALAAADIMLEPGLIDWLPFYDTRMAQVIQLAFPRARFVHLQRDPRDCLLSWLAQGTPQAVALTDPPAAGRWLASAQAHLVAGLSACSAEHLLQVTSADLDAPDALADRLLGFLGLPEAAEIPPLDGLRHGYAGLSTSLPEGRWQAYRGVLADAFAPLGGA